MLSSKAWSSSSRSRSSSCSAWAALRDEIARLKGGPGRPNIKPSGMERGTEPRQPGSSGDKKRPRGSTRSKLTIDEERTVELAAPPPGSRFKGYTSFVVQDLEIRAHVVNFRCERWQAPDGEVVMAPMPAGMVTLDRTCVASVNIMKPRPRCHGLVKLLCSLGIFISKRQVRQRISLVPPWKSYNRTGATAFAPVTLKRTKYLI
jgi:hypothetical protein